MATEFPDLYGNEGFFVNGNKNGYSDAVLARGGHQMVTIEGIGTAPRQMAEEWEAATHSQKSSKEYVDLWNSIVKELDGTAVVKVVGEGDADPVVEIDADPAA